MLAAPPPSSVLALRRLSGASPTLQMRKRKGSTAGSTDLVPAGHVSVQIVPKAENQRLQHLDSEPKGWCLGLQPCTPQRQRLPPSQSPGTMHFAGKFQSISWVTGAEACWHLSSLRNGQRGKLRYRGSAWDKEPEIPKE